MRSGACYSAALAVAALLFVPCVCGAEAEPADAEAQAALSRARGCYRELDYACAEEHLALALRGQLTPELQRVAREHEALIALAFHDEPRARRALRALLALDPDSALGPSAPPRLRRLASEERAVARAAWRVRPWLRLSGGALHLSDADAERWSDGLRGEAGAGVRLGDRLRLGLVGSTSWHVARLFQLDDLRVAHLGAAGSYRVLGGAVGLWAGLGLGAAQVVAAGLTGEQRYWGLLVEAPVDLTVRLPLDLCAVARLAPAVLAVRDDERVAFSLLLPLSLGLCYQP